MHFDFYQQYKDYSNIDLLKIVKRPTDYQPAAVTVATQILNERQITPEEIQHVEQFFQDLDSSANAKKEKLAALKNKATDFFEPVLHPSEKVEPNKWVNILLLVISIQYAWSVFNTIKQLIGFLQCDDCSFDVTLFAELLTLLYVPLIFFLLFKRRLWGWILLFADNLFSLISRASQSYIFFKYQSIHHGDTTSFLLPVLIKAAFVFFMWRDTIANHFGVTHKTKKKTAIIITAGTLLFILTMNLMFGL
jgi:hypothetical protein